MSVTDEYEIVFEAIATEERGARRVNFTAMRIIAGAAWLDSVDPHWWREVVPNMIEMQSTCNCVLGQIVGDYAAAITDSSTLTEHRAEAERRGFTITGTRALALGFEWDPSEQLETYRDLTNGWRALVTSRLQSEGR